MNKIIIFNPRSANGKHRIPNSILQVGASVHGKYEYVFVDGSVYEGSFVNDLREGHGTMLYDDGTKYVGAWRNNWRDGTFWLNTLWIAKLLGGDVTES